MIYMMKKWFIKRRWWAWLLTSLLGLLVVAGTGFVIWASAAAQPQPEALQALQSDDQVTVTADKWYIFEPADKRQRPPVGFIFYPGGRVDAQAYAPEARAIAAEGYFVVIVPMPLNLAVLSPNRASQVIAAFPDVGQWVVGGHSLGGSMAASFAYEQPDEVDGLVLWASYPADWNDLSERTELEVATIYGTLDGLATAEQIEGLAHLLPPQTVWVPIEGGNHAQFGWYGPQRGDLPATISHSAQSDQVVAATLDLLARVADGGAR